MSMEETGYRLVKSNGDSLKRQEEAMSGRQGEITVTDTEIHMLKHHKMCIERAAREGHGGEYARGLYNGIEFTLALIEHREPELYERGGHSLINSELLALQREMNIAIDKMAFPHRVISGVEG